MKLSPLSSLFIFIEVSCSEKQKISRTVRNLEKRLRDATALADEARKQADAYKDQVR